MIVDKDLKKLNFISGHPFAIRSTTIYACQCCIYLSAKYS